MLSRQKGDFHCLTTAFTHMLEISLEVLEGRKLLQRKDLWLQTVSPSQKAKKKNYPGMEE